MEYLQLIRLDPKGSSESLWGCSRIHLGETGHVKFTKRHSRNTAANSFAHAFLSILLLLSKISKSSTASLKPSHKSSPPLNQKRVLAGGLCPDHFGDLNPKPFLWKMSATEKNILIFPFFRLELSCCSPGLNDDPLKSSIPQKSNQAHIGCNPNHCRLVSQT